mmetsp:Transcript_114290/g.210064  ORF Transcript_114290/g.210064 Transcript_114290/m.210064 type:complete len:140 (+) Transcript_114290:139-558(+)
MGCGAVSGPAEHVPDSFVGWWVGDEATERTIFVISGDGQVSFNSREIVFTDQRSQGWSQFNEDTSSFNLTCKIAFFGKQEFLIEIRDANSFFLTYEGTKRVMSIVRSEEQAQVEAEFEQGRGGSKPGYVMRQGLRPGFL